MTCSKYDFQSIEWLDKTFGPLLQSQKSLSGKKSYKINK